MKPFIHEKEKPEIHVSHSKPLIINDEETGISIKAESSKCSKVKKTTVAWMLVIWLTTLGSLGFMYVLSLHCGDQQMWKQGRNTDSTFKGHETDIQTEPGCYINGRTMYITTLHLVGGTVAILVLGILLTCFTLKRC